jgi:hypothetical protein
MWKFMSVLLIFRHPVRRRVSEENSITTTNMLLLGRGEGKVCRCLAESELAL